MAGRTILTTLVALAGIAAMLLAGCTGPAVSPVPTPAPTQTPVAGEKASFGPADNGGTFSVSPGSVIQLRLPENPTTGFSWNLSAPPGISILNDTYIPDDVTGKLIGSGGTHVWFLRAMQPGEQVIWGIYRRAWEPPTASVSTFNLTLVVGENACGGNVCTLPGGTPAVPPRDRVYTDAGNGEIV